PSTLMSRFFRAGLPPAKRFLSLARLTYAARLFENPGISIANVANQLDYSSPQSFSRHVRMLMGFTAANFRERYDGEGMLQFLRDELVLNQLDVWKRFDPFGRSASAASAPSALMSSANIVV
ncbi:MAG: helix-turn-helix domain-containing protein, partial [Gemmatimonadaceae bacterium]